MSGEIQGFANFQDAIKLYRITDTDISAIHEYSKTAQKFLVEFIDDFYIWLPEVSEFKDLFSRAGLVNQVKVKQTEYWRQLFNCQLNEEYLQSRCKVGDMHAQINLPISSYVAGMNFSADWWINKISSSKMSEKKRVVLEGALSKLFYLDVAIISSAYTQATNNLIEKQSRALMELSTPTIQLWDGILVLPILGVLDSCRAQNMTELMLSKIQQTNASSIIIDITGVPTVDSSVANHLIKITKATKLMGCECILSGIGPEIAQILVHLGISLDTIQTSSNLKSAFQLTLLKEGYHVQHKNK
ncbi:MAG: protoglobin domain-containing protein [Legionellaceae bacterium]|nr:protoglobin domain-containing protein [Legionellaceae bacterium]